MADPKPLPTDAPARKQQLQDALRLAVSPQPAEQRQLVAKLDDAAWLGTLDTAMEYRAPPTELRVARVLKELMENSSAAAQESLVALSTRKNFLAARSRQQLLILALVEVRPSPPAAIEFWRGHSGPDAIFRHVTVNALADNGSAPAVKLLGEILADARQPDADRVLWMRDPVLRHRTAPAVLRAADELVRRGSAYPLHASLLEALVDYRPERWYLECDPPRCPSWSAAPAESKQLLQGLARWSLANLKLEPTLAAAVRRAYRETGGNENELPR